MTWPHSFYTDDADDTVLYNAASESISASPTLQSNLITMLQTKSFRTVFQLFQYQSPGNVDRILATVIKSRRCFCPFMCLHCIHWEYCHQLPAVHSDDVIPITDLPARLDQHSLLSFIISASLSLPLLWHHSIHASFTLSFNSSLYHLLMLFSTLVQPFVWLPDLILPSRFMFIFPAGFWMWGGGGYKPSMSSRQIS